MNKQNKLARNAVRLRRAQNKRKDEPNKPKSKQSRKRLISRIVALFGCLLLASALVVPCFAAQPNNAVTDFDSLRDSFGVARDNSYLELFGSSNVSYSRFRSVYDSWFDFASDYTVFSSGNVSYISGASISDYSFLSDSSESSSLSFELWVHDVDIYFYLVNAITSQVKLDYYSRYCDIRFLFENYGVPIIEAYFYFDDEEVFSMSYRAETDLYELRSVRILGTDYMQLAEIGDFSLSLGFQQNFDVGFCSDLSKLFFGSTKLVFPRSELTVFDSAWNSGKELGIKLEKDGYIAGFNDGNSDYSTGFNDGYNDALGQISSGDYGRNLLGNAFAAPFEAVTGIELVSWHTQSGGVISITLGTVFSAIIGVSLFIFFLKMFAGG